MNYSLADLVLNGNALAYYTETSGANTLEYFCFPRQPDDAITDSTWKVMRFTTVTATGAMVAGKCIQWAWGSPEYVNSAADLATVSALSFS